MQSVSALSESPVQSGPMSGPYSVYDLVRRVRVGKSIITIIIIIIIMIIITIIIITMFIIIITITIIIIIITVARPKRELTSEGRASDHLTCHDLKRPTDGIGTPDRKPRN